MRIVLVFATLLLHFSTAEAFQAKWLNQENLRRLNGLNKYSPSPESEEARFVVVLDHGIDMNWQNFIWSLAKDIKKNHSIRFLIPSSRVQVSNKIEELFWIVPDRTRISWTFGLDPTDVETTIKRADVVFLSSSSKLYPSAHKYQRPVVFLDKFSRDISKVEDLEEGKLGMVLVKEEWVGDYALISLYDKEYQKSLYEGHSNSLEEKPGLKLFRQREKLVLDESKLKAPQYFYKELNRRANDSTLKRRFAELQAQEPHLQALYEKLKSNKQLPSHVLKLSNEEQVQRILAAEPTLLELREKLNSYNLQAYELMLDYIATTLARQYTTKFKSLSSEQHMEIKETMKTLFYEVWFSNSQKHHYYGAPDPYKRLKSTSSIHENVKSLVSMLGGGAKIEPGGTFGINNLGQFLRVFDFWNKQENAPDKNQGRTVVGEIENLVRDLMSDKKVNVTVENREILKKIEDDRDVVVYAMNHNNGYRDLVAQTALDIRQYDHKSSSQGVGSYMLVAGGPRYPNILGKPLYEKSPSFIYVGRNGGEPLKFTKDGLKSNLSNQIFILPEGALNNSVMFDSKNFRDKFFSGYLKPIMDSSQVEGGYNVSYVSIVCLTCRFYMNNLGTFSGAYDDEYDKNIKVRVLGRYEPPVLRALIDKEKYSALSIFFRLGWMEALHDYHGDFIGQNSLKMAVDEFHNRIKAPKLVQLGL